MGTLRDSKRVLGEHSVSVYMGALRGKLGWRAPLLGTLKASSYQYTETESETDFGPSPTAKTRLLSFNRAQSKFVIRLFIGDNTLRRHFYLLGLTIACM